MTPAQKKQQYKVIRAQLEESFRVTSDPVSRMATAAALLYHGMGHFFWVGFYRLVDGRLLVGPYQGTPACVKLKTDTGVCCAAVCENRVINVPDVNKFTGHIACDARSKSEIAVPCRSIDGTVWATLDADSEKYGAFDEIDEQELSAIADLLVAIQAES